MATKWKNLLIGLFVLAACVLMVSTILFLEPTVGDGKKILEVRFSNINQITIGTRVTYAGRPVGEVVAISEIYEARSQPADSLGRLYFYQLTLRVDSSVEIYNTDVIEFQTSGLLGEKSVAIIPKKPAKGVVPHLITNEPIYADSVDPLESTMHQLKELSEKMGKTFDNVNDWFVKNEDELSNAVKSFSGALKEIQTAVHSVNTEQVIPELKTAVVQFGKAMHEIQQGIAVLRTKNTFQHIGSMVAKLDDASGSIQVITEDIASGKGTIGRLVKDDGMYLQVSSILSKADTLMNDINHYGLLFHLNKSWQRLRTQRMNWLNSLETPQQFKQYFESEVDDINTAMGRLSTLIDRAQEKPETEKILQSPMFRDDFADLMRQVNELSDQLKLYNEQLQSAAGK